jgi:AcrR family transcriptional regulator
VTEAVTAPKGISPEQVVTAAIELTAELGLTSWSVRELAGRLGVAPSAVYHHVGHRAEVIRQVSARLVSQVPRPDADLPWELWFEQMLASIRTVLLAHPGVAHWFMMHGPSLPEAVDIVDAGIACLHRAGFGDNAAFAYAMLFNQGVGSIAFAQDRRQADAADGDRSLNTLLPRFAELARTSAGLAELTTGILTPTLDDPAVAEANFRRSLRILMRGLAVECLPGAGSQ